MALDKLTKLTSNSGISTVIDYTMSDLVVDSINIAGGGTTLGKDFETRNLKVTGLSTFIGNVQMDGNLTVNGTTTTLDTNLIGVDRVEVVANDNNYAGIAVTQSGTGDIISAYDGSTAVFLVNDGNKVGIADSIYHIGDDNTAFGFPAADTFKIDTAGVERLRIDSSGRALVGHNASLDQNAQLQSFTTGTDTFAGFKYGNNASPNIIRLGKSRNASAGGNTIVADDDEIGRILFSGNDGSSFKDAAYISGFVDGSPSTGNDMPGRLSFFTSPDGSLPSLERLRIDRNGNVGVGTITPNGYSNYTTFTINGTTGGQIDIESNSTKYGDIYTQSNTLHIRNKQSSGSGALVFHTTNSGTSGEKVRIDSSGSLLFNQTQSKILVNTSDGSDSSWLNINGGGDASQSRGAGVAFYGNENSGSEGKLWLLAGNSGSTNGTITMSTGGTPRATLTSAGDLVVGDTTYGATGSFSAKSNGEFRSVLPQSTASSTMLGAIGGASNGFNIVTDSSNGQTYKFHNGSSQAVTITDNGRIYIGHASSGTYDGIQPQVQLEGTNYNTSSMSLFCNNNSSNNAPQLQLGKSRSGSDGGSTALQDDDRVGSIYGIAADGTDRNSSVASIQFYVDGTVASNTTPGSIRFATTATTSGSSTPTERLRIDSDGRLLVNGAAATNAFTGGDDLIIGNASSGTRSGMTLVSHSGQDGGIYFSRGTSSNSDYVKGQIVYNHSSDYLAFYTGATGIRLKISEKGGHNLYNDEGYYAGNLTECNDDKVALNIRKTRNGHTKGIALGAIGAASHTAIQAYDSSDNSANELALNPFGGALLVGLTAPTYGSGDMQHEIKKDNSRTYTAPLMAAHSHLLLNNSDTTNGAFCGIGIRAGTGDGAIGFNYRGATNHSDFVIATDSGANGVEGFRIKSQTRTCSIGDNVDPLNALHILDRTTSEWDGALNANRAVLRLETHWQAINTRAIGDYGSGIVFNHLGGHSSSHNNDSHAWLGLRVHDTPGYERSCLVFATNDITASESGHDAGLKERMQINPHGQVAINYTGTMVSNSHARLWIESIGNNLATEWDPGDNQGALAHLTLAGQNNHVRLDMGTMDVAPFAGYIQARYDNSPDLGASDTADGLEPLQIQPRGGQTYFNFGHSTTYPGNFSAGSAQGGIKMRAGTANSTSVSEANTAIKIWPAQERVHIGQKGDADEGSKYGGIAWLVLDSQSPGNSGWAPYDGNQCWMGMSLHSTPGQELGNWQLRMNSSGNQNSVANNIALQASPQGWVTKPNAIVFMAHHNNGTRITSTGYQTFGDQIEDNGGDHYSNSNGKFTAPIGGYYYLYLKVNAVKRIDMQIRINGSTDHTHREIGQFNTSNDADGWWSHNIVRIFRMETNEYAQVYISSLNQQTDPGEWCTFGGFLIG